MECTETVISVNSRRHIENVSDMRSMSCEPSCDKYDQFRRTGWHGRGGWRRLSPESFVNWSEPAYVWPGRKYDKIDQSQCEANGKMPRWNKYQEHYQKIQEKLHAIRWGERLKCTKWNDITEFKQNTHKNTNLVVWRTKENSLHFKNLKKISFMSR